MHCRKERHFHFYWSEKSAPLSTDKRMGRVINNFLINFLSQFHTNLLSFICVIHFIMEQMQKFTLLCYRQVFSILVKLFNECEYTQSAYFAPPLYNI